MSIIERKLKNGKSVYDNAFMYKNIRYKKRGFKTKKAAQQYETSVKYEIDNNIYTVTCNKTFIEVYNEWLSLNIADYSPNTTKTYISASNKFINHRIGSMRIADMSHKLIQEFFNELGIKYKRGTCINVIKLFNATFEHALKNKYIKNDPMQFVKVKGEETKKDDQIEVISYSQFIAICDEFIKNDTFNNKALRIALEIGYYTGARVTEVLALEKSDINFSDNTITLNHRLQCGEKGKKPYKTKMKTKKSYATLPLAKPLKMILADWFKINPYNDICVYEDGEYINYAWIQKKCQLVSKRLGIPFHFHMLRHTLATNLALNDISPSIAKELLRHASIKTTINIYTHVDKQKQTDALNSIFSNNKKTNYPKITPKVN